METTLEMKITQILRRGGGPLRAIDIVRALADDGTVTDKATVNKTLYNGPFAKTAGGGTPTWTAALRPATDLALSPGHFAFRVDAIGAFILRDDLPRESVEVLLRAALSLVPEGTAAVVRPDDSAGGKAVAEFAAERAVVEPLGH